MPPIPSPRVTFHPPEEKSCHSVQGESQGVEAQCPGRRWVSAEQTGGGHSAGIGSEGLLPLGSKQVLTSESPPFQAWDHEEQVASGLKSHYESQGLAGKMCRPGASCWQSVPASPPTPCPVGLL